MHILFLYITEKSNLYASPSAVESASTKKTLCLHNQVAYIHDDRPETYIDGGMLFQMNGLDDNILGRKVRSPNVAPNVPFVRYLSSENTSETSAYR